MSLLLWGAFSGTASVQLEDLATAGYKRLGSMTSMHREMSRASGQDGVRLLIRRPWPWAPFSVQHHATSCNNSHCHVLASMIRTYHVYQWSLLFIMFFIPTFLFMIKHSLAVACRDVVGPSGVNYQLCLDMDGAVEDFQIFSILAETLHVLPESI